MCYEKTAPTLTIPTRQVLIERRCGTEHIVHIRYARYCGGGSSGRDRGNGVDSMMQSTQSKRHTYMLAYNGISCSCHVCAANKLHRNLPSQVDRG